MKLVRFDIRNFRLLRDASVRMDETQTTTILVGPNNSGKTSVAEALLLFTEGSGKDFSIYDLSGCCWASFAATEQAMLADASGSEAALIPPLPSMSMDLHFL
jgi:putative ATP-dependent endonuclease of OLD family